MNNVKMDNIKHPAIVLGMSANGLSVARALGEKNIKVIGVDHNPRMEGMFSRYLWKKYICPYPDSDEFIEFLYSLGHEHPEKCVVFPTADEYLLPLSEYRDDFHRHFIYLLPSKEIVSCFLDKEKTSKFALKYGIPHPKTAVVSTADELDEAIDQVGLPCFFKPIISHITNKYITGKGFEAHTREQCFDFYKKVLEMSPRMLLQEVIPGGEGLVYEYMAYCDQQSTILADFTGRKVRQYPPKFGIGCLSESIRNQELATLGKKIIQETDYKGLVHFECKNDPRTKKFIFLETNLRTSYIGQLSVASGINLPWIAYLNLVSGYLPQQPLSQVDGIKLLNIVLDLGHYVRARSQDDITLRQWLSAFNTLNIAHAYWRWNDPLPWVMVYSRLLSGASRKALSFFIRRPSA